MLEDIRALLAETLQLGARGKALDANSQLLGALPELDSMAVVSVVTAIEDQYDIEFDDDELSAETFETLGSLVALVEHKVGN